MTTQTKVITVKGDPINLLGNQLDVGQEAPDFTVLDNELSPVSLSSFKSKVCIISAVPSLDTPVCDIQTRRFNQEASQLGENVAILTISMDLPFAQKRWCAAAGVENLHTLSDHRDASFGNSFGLVIEGLRLLARAIYVLDADGIIRYQQIVPELTEEPDYDAAIEVAKKLL